MIVILWWHFLIFVLTIFGSLYIFMKYKYTYWSSRGVEYFDPTFPLGNVKDALLMRKNLATVLKDLHLKIKTGYAGIYCIHRPTLLVRDRELLQKILVDDFEYFTDRVEHLDLKHDPILNNIYYLCGDKWSKMRHILTPIFSPCKLPAMFKTVYDIGMTLQGFTGCIADKDADNSIDIRDLSARYLTDVIASIAFGIEVDSIRDPTTYFRKIGARIADPTCHKTFIAYLLSFMAPKLISYLRLKVIDDEIDEFMIETVRRTLQYREKHKLSREDFMQLLIQIRNGVDVDQTDFKECNFNVLDDQSKHLSIEDCAAQVFIFFAAGFETSSLLMAFCLLELARNPTIMQKVQDDVDRTLNKHNWKLTCECLKDMKYLSQCIDETLRLYPPCPYIPRICTKDYIIPKTSVKLEKGLNIMISNYGIQRDPENYPNPDKFDPSRFSPEEKAKRPAVDFLSYGLGPRDCIAKEFGYLISAMGLAALIAKFDFKVIHPKSSDFCLDSKSYLIYPEGGIHLNVKRRVFVN